MSPQSDTLSRLRANQSLLYLLHAACLAEKQQIQILVIGLTRSGLEPMIYRIQGEHPNHYTTDAYPSNNRHEMSFTKDYQSWNSKILKSNSSMS